MSSAPTRTRSGSGMARPHTMAAPPAAMNDLPRVVSEPNSARMALLPPGLPGQPRPFDRARSAAREGQLGNDSLDHVLGQVPFHDGFRRGQHPVREHRAGQRLHVVRDNVVPSVERRPGAAGPQ